MRPALLVPLLLSCASACNRDVVAPADVEQHALAFATGRGDGTVIVPVQVQMDLHYLVDQSAQARAACDPRPGLAVGTGKGEATHLGRFEVIRMDHCSVDLAVTPPLLDATGTFEWRAADGSRIEGTYAFLFLPPENGGFFTLSVEGGTGRFEGATGHLEFNERSGPVVCVDPLCLDGANWFAVFDGWLSIPHP